MEVEVKEDVCAEMHCVNRAKGMRTDETEENMRTEGSETK
jgi:hypothetical protein